MKEFLVFLREGVYPGLEGSAALFLTLSLCQFFPLKQLRLCLPLIIGFGILCGTAEWWELPGFYLTAAAAILTVWIKFALSTLWLYGIIAGLMAGSLFGIQMLLTALNVPKAGILLGDGVLILFCQLQNTAVLPKLDDLPAARDKEQSRQFVFSLVLSVVSYVGMLLWISCLEFHFSQRSVGEQVIAMIFTGFSLLILLVFTRRLSFDAVERIEALLDKQYQGELLNFMQVIRSQRHDFNFHMQAISGMIEAGHYEECREYVSQMTKNISVMNDMLPLHDPAVSAMLNSFREMALQKGITLDVSVYNDLARMPCSIYKTNTIIGNLIQNAMDEVEENSDNRWINVLILKRGGDIIIKVTNPCSRSPEELKDIFRPGYSTKQSHEGIGLTTVTRLAARYHGSVHPEFDNGNISFIVRIPAE